MASSIHPFLTILHHPQYIGELCLLEADPYLQYKPSIIAAASLATARHCVLCERCAARAGREGREEGGAALPGACAGAAWPAALAACAGYALHELEPALRELARTHAHVSLQPYQAIPDKYKSNKSVLYIIQHALSETLSSES